MNIVKKKYQALGRLQKAFLYSVSLILIYTLCGFFLLPYVAMDVAQKKLSNLLARPVSIASIKTNPFALTAEINGFKIMEKEGTAPFISFARLHVNIQANSLFKLAPIVSRLSLEEPSFHMAKRGLNDYNFSDIIETLKPNEPASSEKEASKPFPFAIYNITVSGGNGIIEDETIHKTHTITDLNLGIPFISNIDESIDIFVSPHFSAIFNDTPILMDSKIKPFHNSMETIVDIDFKSINLPHYFAYLPVKTNITLKSGLLDLKAHLVYIQNNDKSPKLLCQGEITLKKIEICDLKDNQLLKLPRLIVKLDPSRPMKGEINLAAIRMDSPEIGITRRADGRPNIYDLIPGAKTDNKPDKGSNMQVKLNLGSFKISDAHIYLTDRFQVSGDKGADTSDLLTISTLTMEDIALDTKKKEIALKTFFIDGGDAHIRRQPSDQLNVSSLAPSEKEEPNDQPKKNATKPSPWNVFLERLTVDHLNIKGENLANARGGNLRINDLKIDGGNLTNQKNQVSKISIACKVNEKSDISINSDFSVTPPSAAVDFDIQKINLSWFQPFIKRRLDLTVNDGKLYSKGHFLASLHDDADPDFTFKGDASIHNLNIGDKTGSENLFKWKKLRIDGIDFGYPAPHANISKVKLKDLTCNLTVMSNGDVNIFNIIPIAEAAIKEELEEREKKETPPMPIEIGQVLVENGTVNIIDRSIDPDYSTSFQQINATVKGLSSDRKKLANVDLTAFLNGNSPLTIQGRANPLANEIYADVNLLFKNLDLSPISPYSGRYMGNKIHKGKLSMELGYLIENSTLTSTNKVFIDQLELGEKVESKDAVDLPLSLGIALLKDRQGRINLDIPVSGKIDDPKFSVIDTILDVIVNLFAKAITAPFAMIGSMFGGDEDINLIAFTPGSIDLADSATKKIDTLVTAMFERPGLKLEIMGYTDIDADRKAIIDENFNLMLRREKLKEMIQGGITGITIESITLSPEEQEKYLLAIYEQHAKHTKTDKEQSELTDHQIPSGETVTAEPVTPEMMKEKVLSNIRVNDAELRLLASRRALIVKKQILLSEKIDQSRVFLVEPETLNPEPNESIPQSRVELFIK